MRGLCHGVFKTVEQLDGVLCLKVEMSYEFWMFAAMFSMVSLKYSVMIFLGVIVESVILMMFDPASIHLDSFYLSAIFLSNRLMEFDYPSKSSGGLRMALLNSLMPVVEV